MALDLGGTNFRVLLCKMRNGVCESLSRNYNVPKPKLYGPAAGVSFGIRLSCSLYSIGAVIENFTGSIS